MSLFDKYPKDVTRRFVIKEGGAWKFKNFPAANSAFNTVGDAQFFEITTEFGFTDGKVTDPSNLSRYGKAGDILVRYPNNLYDILDLKRYRTLYGKRNVPRQSTVISSREEKAQDILEIQARKQRTPLSNTMRPAPQVERPKRPVYHEKTPQGSR